MPTGPGAVATWALKQLEHEALKLAKDVGKEIGAAGRNINRTAINLEHQGVAAATSAHTAKEDVSKAAKKATDAAKSVAKKFGL